MMCKFLKTLLHVAVHVFYLSHISYVVVKPIMCEPAKKRKRITKLSIRYGLNLDALFCHTVDDLLQSNSL